jgi:hypothetical protein
VYNLAMQALSSIEPFLVESMGYKKTPGFPEDFVVYQVFLFFITSSLFGYYSTGEEKKISR